MDPGSRPPVPRLLFAGCLSLALGGALPQPSAGQVPEYQLKAEFIERFTRFIEWPEPQGSDPSTPFTIGLFGGNPFGRYLEDLTNRRTIGGRHIKVQEVSSLAEVDGCQMLFICGSGRRNLPRILARTESRPILTVGDTEGFAEQGVIINFFSLDNTIGFEINDSAVHKSGLQVSSKLLKLARIVK